ncbi:MAG: bifunctional 4-hydroxy-2-oxoglutarate aldolase/2-dehydro-3-deoxy-phosphogluconate aldolase [Ktedonobacteraceae bacterium]|nr:bifunctional 4-hydroxy-2-oxoglutarate aldolase/2-dehydro-3-deoxy-phosphogluconate aldolase [Ktedonobacteraceae bacterium]
MTDILKQIIKSRIVAIIRLEQYTRAAEIACALLEGGITTLEFTLTGSGAYRAIREARAAVGARSVVGVGTVLEASEVREAVEAGAQFVVTPVLRPAVIKACKEWAVPVICGALTPTEAQNAYDAGADMIKIFPARVGGPQYIRDILAPLPHLKLAPTGGVSKENARAYLEAGAAVVGIGGNLIARRAVEEGDWAQITAQARACVEAVQ